MFDVLVVKLKEGKIWFYLYEKMPHHDIMSSSNEPACDVNIMPSFYRPAFQKEIITPCLIFVMYYLYSLRFARPPTVTLRRCSVVVAAASWMRRSPLYVQIQSGTRNATMSGVLWFLGYPVHWLLLEISVPRI